MSLHPRFLPGWPIRRLVALFPIMVVAVLVTGHAVARESEVFWEPRAGDAGGPTSPLLPAAPVALILDDDFWEGEFGNGLGASRQFFWFNRFTSPGGDFQIEEIWVLFPQDPTISVGSAVDVVVYLDPDVDPRNGATHLATYHVTVQVTDDNTFSVYPLVPPLDVVGAGYVLIGVADRYVVSGVTAESKPATLDTTASQGCSWFATWATDPADPPDLATAAVIAPVDTVPPGGNWMIRAFGRQAAAAVTIPTLDGVGLMIMAALLVLAGVCYANRRLGAESDTMTRSP